MSERSELKDRVHEAMQLRVGRIANPLTNDRTPLLNCDRGRRGR